MHLAAGGAAVAGKCTAVYRSTEVRTPCISTAPTLCSIFYFRDNTKIAGNGNVPRNGKVTAQISRHAACSLEISAISVCLLLLQKLVSDAHTLHSMATQNGMSELKQAILYSMILKYAAPLCLY
jgi:hypothetical protein